MQTTYTIFASFPNLMDLIDLRNRGPIEAQQKSEIKWANTKNMPSSFPSRSKTLCKKCYERSNIKLKVDKFFLI